MTDTQGPSAPKRYDLEETDSSHSYESCKDLRPNADGDWVRWEDYEALRAEADVTRAQLWGLQTAAKVWKKSCDTAVEAARAHVVACEAERAVLDAMAALGDDVLIIIAQRYPEAVSAMEAELARRQGKT